MDNRISDLLDCMEEAGRELKPQGGNARRVRERTLAKLHGVSELPLPRRRIRPLNVLIAAAVAVTLLCGTVFAAWKLGAFHFADTMGPEGALLDQWAVTYPSEDVPVVSADGGYAHRKTAQAENYNLVLIELAVMDGQLRAELEVSPRDETTPPFRDSGLRLSIDGYETRMELRKLDNWVDRVNLTANLAEPLPDGAEACFVFSGGDTQTITEAFPVNASRYESCEEPVEFQPKLATVAETKDYRFSLRTLAVSKMAIYAVVEIEALSDFGMAHLDSCPELVFSNQTNPGSSGILDPKLMESGEGVRRYLMASIRSYGENEVGDVIEFELLSLLEEGDMAGHAYRLFDVRVEQLVCEEMTVVESSGEVPEGDWKRLELEPLGLTLKKTHVPYSLADTPQVVLVFRDGTRETILDDDNSFYGPEAPMPEGHRAVLVDWGGWRDGTEYLSLLFARPVRLETLAAVEVNGQVFPIEE